MAPPTPPRALVLLSGGLDSATVLAIARSEGYDVTALIFRYGQRHAIETELAAAMASSLGVPSRVQDLDLSAIGASALTSSALEVPTDRSEAEMSTGVPVTYVPARNTIFLAYALAWAEVLRAPEIFIGVNALDYSGYPDCRPEYIAAFERLADLATRASTEEGVRFRIHTPLLHKTKAEIIAWGVRLGVDYSRTWSCYAPVLRPGSSPLACGRCDSCLLRKKGFREAGVEDPTGYAGG